MWMREWGKGLWDEDGAAMSEYGLLLALIAAVVIVVAVIFGEALYEIYRQFPELFPDWIRTD